MALWISCSSLSAAAQPQAAESADPPAFPVWTATAGQSNAQFGISVATAGDVNGDGFSDIIVGARDYTRSNKWEGAAFVYHGSASGLPAEPSWAVFAGERNANFGNSVASAGDVNRDGFDDVIVGAYSSGFRSGIGSPGSVLLYLGSPQGLSRTPAWSAQGPQVDSSFAYSVSGAGDVNGDGFPDLIVGAHNFRQTAGPLGKVYVFHGSARGFGATADWRFTGDQTRAEFGYRVASAGDVNGDDFGDVIISARDHDSGRAQRAGKVFVFHGSRRGLSWRPDWSFEGQQAFGGLGIDCAAAGDVNRDGFGDVIVGAFGESHGEQREGAAYVFYGSPRGLGWPNWFAECNRPGSVLGHAVGSAGDLNLDGFADVIIGAPGFNAKIGDEGRAYVFYGSREGLGTEAAWAVSLDRYRLRLGRPVATAGDVNRDGFVDVILGGLMDKADPEGGQVSVFAGSSAGLTLAGVLPKLDLISARRLNPPAPPWWRQGWFWGTSTAVLAVVAAALGHALTTARLKRRLRRAEQQHALEQERLRIAQDLHDHLGSNLTTIALLSDVARRDIRAPEKVEDHLSSITGTARDLTRSLEEIVWAVNPRKDNLDQMVSYFSAYAEEFLKPTDLRCRLDFPDELPELVVPSETRHGLLLVFKEALTNVLKHAAATEVRIGLHVSPPRVALSIEDNGRGFDTAAPPSQRNGLANMHARIERLGGVCEISSRINQGTRIRVEVRLDGGGRHPACQ